jgi:hypothetical protein
VDCSNLKREALNLRPNTKHTNLQLCINLSRLQGFNNLNRAFNNRKLTFNHKEELSSIKALSNIGQASPNLNTVVDFLLVLGSNLTNPLVHYKVPTLHNHQSNQEAAYYKAVKPIHLCQSREISQLLGNSHIESLRPLKLSITILLAVEIFKQAL